MIKKILLILIILAVAAAAAVYFFFTAALNKGIQQGVETFGPQVTQTPVTLADVSISVLSGKGTLRDLNVGNPEGYKQENIFALGQIDIDIDTGTVLSDKIIINQIYIRQPEISYEKTFSSSNVKKLLENIEQFTGPSTPSEEAPKEETGAKKQVVIKQLIIEDATVFVGALGVGQSVTLPRIELNNIGEDGNRQSIAQVLDLVISEVIKAIGPAIAGGTELLKGTADDAVKALQESGVEKADEAINKATDSIKGLFNK